MSYASTLPMAVAVAFVACATFTGADARAQPAPSLAPAPLDNGMGTLPETPERRALAGGKPGSVMSTWSPDAPLPPHAAIAAAVDSRERSKSDRETDASRRYAEMLEFWGVRPGMEVLDVFGAHAITTEVLARTVGRDGRVLLQNPPWYYKRFTRKLVDEHLRDNRLPNVIEVQSPFMHIPVPPNSVDGITLYAIFHDMFWMEPGNVPAILNEMMRVVKPGGFVGIADHAAPDGAGLSMSCGGCRHRLEEKTVRRMFLQAGFLLEAESDALRNPADDRTQTAFESPVFHGDTDRFLLRFRKAR